MLPLLCVRGCQVPIGERKERIASRQVERKAVVGLDRVVPVRLLVFACRSGVKRRVAFVFAELERRSACGDSDERAASYPADSWPTRQVHIGWVTRQGGSG